MKDNKKDMREAVFMVLLLLGLALIGWALYLWHLVAFLLYLGVVFVFWAVCIAVAEEKGGEKE